MLSKKLLDYLDSQHLYGEAFVEIVETYYQPLAQKLAAKHQSQKQAGIQKPIVVGINGGQGSGKSTLAQILAHLMRENNQLRVAVMSLDDFYLSKHKRAVLAEKIHPLFATRGVPGTHDVGLGMRILNDLLDGVSVKMPVFDKGSDDLLHEEKWFEIKDKVDVVLFEGWCVGATPLPENSLSLNENKLEKSQDVNLVWRRHYNQQLANVCQDWFAMIDVLVMLKVPSLTEVITWRSQQEEAQLSSARSNFDVEAFVAYFARLTQHMLTSMPRRAAVVFDLDSNHQITQASGSLWEEKVL